jgi:hypothetical protein
MYSQIVDCHVIVSLCFHAIVAFAAYAMRADLDKKLQRIEKENFIVR